MSEPILGYDEFVRLVVDALEAAGIEYLIGGAVASWAWGEPRSTLDLDLVVLIPPESVGALSEELKIRDMLVPADIIFDALIENRVDLPINAIHLYSGFKADLYPLREPDELRVMALRRRVKVDFGPPVGEVYVHSPEDLILYKTSYFSLSQQTKHIRDIAAILRSHRETLDYAYLNTWMERKGLQSVWKEILSYIQG
jgi:hypothetical protein